VVGQVAERGVAVADPKAERERKVATAVASGRTNREVAASLFLSEKTIETPLTRI